MDLIKYQSYNYIIIKGTIKGEMYVSLFRTNESSHKKAPVLYMRKLCCIEKMKGTRHKIYFTIIVTNKKMYDKLHNYKDKEEIWIEGYLYIDNIKTTYMEDYTLEIISNKTEQPIFRDKSSRYIIAKTIY